MMKRSIFVLVVLYSAVGQAAIVEWRVADGGNGHFYEAVLGAIYWGEARDNAYASGGYLVSITSAEENEFVFALVDHPDFWRDYAVNAGLGPWLGAFQPEDAAEPEEGWEWLSGEPFDYTNWAEGQPAGDDTEDYLHFFGAESPIMPTWNDVPESYYAMNGYIVEYIPEPTTLLLFGLGGVFLRKLRIR